MVTPLRSAPPPPLNATGGPCSPAGARVGEIGGADSGGLQRQMGPSWRVRGSPLRFEGRARDPSPPKLPGTPNSIVTPCSFCPYRDSQLTLVVFVYLAVRELSGWAQVSVIAHGFLLQRFQTSSGMAWPFTGIIDIVLVDSVLAV